MTTPLPPDEPTVTLYRPTGPGELALVGESGWGAWPPRLEGRPIFYPVLNEDYAARIARDWNVPRSGSGYVTRFKVAKAFLDNYEVHQVGGQTILEYWIPAEDLAELNASIIGTIEVIATYAAPAEQNRERQRSSVLTRGERFGRLREARRPHVSYDRITAVNAPKRDQGVRATRRNSSPWQRLRRKQHQRTHAARPAPRQAHCGLQQRCGR
jgi:hypothetical protein